MWNTRKTRREDASMNVLKKSPFFNEQFHIFRHNQTHLTPNFPPFFLHPAFINTTLAYDSPEVRTWRLATLATDFPRAACWDTPDIPWKTWNHLKPSAASPPTNSGQWKLTGTLCRDDINLFACVASTFFNWKVDLWHRVIYKTRAHSTGVPEKRYNPQIIFQES